jgi:myo-inositol 2-dehydrogenase/D-chiro-inositol 1-dehydrogenase
VLRDLAQVEVVAVAARSDETLVRARQAFRDDLAVYHNYHDLLADERVHAVLIATPSALQAEVSLWALRAGKHVFVEPPFGETPDQACQLLDEAEEIIQGQQEGRVFQGDLELGYIPALHRLRQMLGDGLLGEPLSVSVRLWCDWGTGGKAGAREGARIGLFVWVGPWYLHVLDLLTGLSPRRVSAVGVRAMNGPLMDYGWASMEYDDGLVGRFDFNLVAVEGQDIRVEAVGTRGEARMDLITGELRWRTADATEWQSERVPPAEPIVAFAGMRECLTGFVRAVTDGEPVLADLAACRRVHQLAYAAQQAAEEGIAVDLPADEPTPG